MSELTADNLEALCSMGFGEQHARLGWDHVGASGFNAVLQWCLDNPDAASHRGEAQDSFASELQAMGFSESDVRAALRVAGSRCETAHTVLMGPVAIPHHIPFPQC